MLEGLIIAVHHTEALEEMLNEASFPRTKVSGECPEEFLRAAKDLGYGVGELLALVETDRAQDAAAAAGFICIGYVNTEIPRQELRKCRLILLSFEGADLQLFRNVHTRALGQPVIIADTGRLIIREMTLDDIPPLRKICRESGVPLFREEQGEDDGDDEDKARSYIEYMYGIWQFGMWTVAEKDTGRVVGRAGLGIADFLGKAEIDLGYVMAADRRGMGYAYEACRAVLEYAFGVLELPAVAAYIEEGNEASLRLADRLGFIVTGEFEHEGAGIRRLERRNTGTV